MIALLRSSRWSAIAACILSLEIHNGLVVGAPNSSAAIVETIGQLFLHLTGKDAVLFSGSKRYHYSDHRESRAIAAYIRSSFRTLSMRISMARRRINTIRVPDEDRVKICFALYRLCSYRLISNYQGLSLFAFPYPRGVQERGTANDVISRHK